MWKARGAGQNGPQFFVELNTNAEEEDRPGLNCTGETTDSIAQARTALQFKLNEWWTCTDNDDDSLCEED
jgi:hypothetical protein